MVLLYYPNLKMAARELRLHMTEAEKKIWTVIRRKKLCGIQFYRQKIIGPYIVDFYGPAANLVIEIDGAQHLNPENIEQDQYRDAYLQELGLRVLRFGNDRVKNALSKVIQEIKIAIQENRNASYPL